MVRSTPYLSAPKHPSFAPEMGTGAQSLTEGKSTLSDTKGSPSKNKDPTRGKEREGEEREGGELVSFGSYVPSKQRESSREEVKLEDGTLSRGEGGDVAGRTKQDGRQRESSREEVKLEDGTLSRGEGGDVAGRTKQDGRQRENARKETERPFGGNESYPLSSSSRKAEVDLPEESTYTPPLFLSHLHVESASTSAVSGWKREDDTLLTQREMEGAEPSGYLLIASQVRAEETDLPLREDSTPYAREPTPMSHDEREIFRASKQNSGPTKRTILDGRGELKNGYTHVLASEGGREGERTLLAKGGMYDEKDMFRATRRVAEGGRREERKLVEKPVRSSADRRIRDLPGLSVSSRGGILEGTDRILPVLG